MARLAQQIGEQPQVGRLIVDDQDVGPGTGDRRERGLTHADQIHPWFNPAKVEGKGASVKRHPFLRTRGDHQAGLADPLLSLTHRNSVPLTASCEGHGTTPLFK
ncbi:hypothetical protein JCM17961_25530 [Endothiovibrio diazotrophicus]